MILHGRFFRYLKRDPKGPKHAKHIAVESTVKPVGKNACAQIGKNIATFLRLENPDNYTGQCWRGTATTFCADAGMSAQQTRAVTGHSSERSLQVYVDNSTVQKHIAASAISLDKTSLSSGNNTTLKRKRERDEEERESRKRINVTINMSNSTCHNISIKTGADDSESESE